LKTKIVEPVALDRAPIGCFKAVLERVSALHFRALQQGPTSSLFKFRTTKEKGKVIFNNVAVYAQRLIYIYIYIKVSLFAKKITIIRQTKITNIPPSPFMLLCISI
jgi:hypothetical protein